MYSLNKNKAVTIAGILAILIGIFVITAWVFNFPGLEDISTQYVSMRFNTALCFILVGLSLYITQREKKKYQEVIFLSLSIFLAAISALSLSQDIFNFNSGIDQLFVTDRYSIAEKYPYPGRMAISVSSCFLIFSMAFIGFSFKNQFLKIVSQYLLHLVTAISAVAIIGYLFGVELFYTLTNEGAMAINTAILFFCLSIVASLLNPYLGITDLFTGRFVGNKMAKRLFILIVLTTLIFEALWLLTGQHGLYSVKTGVSLLTLGFLLASLLSIWYIAYWLNEIDQKRYEAETEIKLMNQELEKRVNERSAKLIDALEKLGEVELKFRTIAEKSMVGIYIYQKNSYIYVNPRFAEIFGYTAPELTDETDFVVRKIIEDEYQETVLKNIRLRLEGEVENLQYEVRGKKKDGATVFVEFYGSYAIINGEPSIIGTMLDVTERKMAEELILKEKKLLDSIINSLPYLFYICDENGRFLRWNKNLEITTGYTPEELGRLTAGNLTYEADRKIADEAEQKVFHEGYATVESRMVAKDGSVIPFLRIGASIAYENKPCFLILSIDISARIKAEEQLKSSEQKYKMLFDANPLPLSMVVKDDLSFVAVNEATARLYGYSKDELLKMKASDFRPKEDRDLQLESFQLEFSDPTDTGIIRHVKKDGTIIFVRLFVHDILFEGREIRLCLANDITEQLKAEELLQKSEANLKAIMDVTDEGYLLFTPEFSVIAYNPMAVKICSIHYNHNLALGDIVTDFIPRERLETFVTSAENALKGQNVSYEVKYVQPNGTEFWYSVRLFRITNEKDELISLMISMTDITDRKNAEGNLKSAYNSIQEHLASIKDMAWKQSHLIRSPLANLKGLATILEHDHFDMESLNYFRAELERLDKIIVEMAEDVSNL